MAETPTIVRRRVSGQGIGVFSVCAMTPCLAPAAGCAPLGAVPCADCEWLATHLLDLLEQVPDIDHSVMRGVMWSRDKEAYLSGADVSRFRGHLADRDDPVYCSMCESVLDAFLPPELERTKHHTTNCPWLKDLSGDTPRADALLAAAIRQLTVTDDRTVKGLLFTILYIRLAALQRGRPAPENSLLGLSTRALDLSTQENAERAMLALPHSIVAVSVLPRLPYPVFAQCYYAPGDASPLEDLDVDALHEWSMRRHALATRLEVPHVLDIFGADAAMFRRTFIPLAKDGATALKSISDYSRKTFDIVRDVRELSEEFGVKIVVIGGSVVTAVCDTMGYETGQDIDLFVECPSDPCRFLARLNDKIRANVGALHQMEGELRTPSAIQKEVIVLVRRDTDPVSVVTFFTTDKTDAPIQVIFTKGDPARAMGAFDMDVCGVMLDGETFKCTHRALHALHHGFNRIGLGDNESDASLLRAEKYERRGVRAVRMSSFHVAQPDILYRAGTWGDIDDPAFERISPRVSDHRHFRPVRIIPGDIHQQHDGTLVLGHLCTVDTATKERNIRDMGRYLRDAKALKGGHDI